MSFVKNCAFSIGLFALAAGLTASQANAQTLRGTFNLPFEAYWGPAVLEPGEYTITYSTQGHVSPTIYVTRQGKTVMLLAAPGRTIAESNRSYLRIENIGEARVIREFNSGATGQQLTFLIPKSVKNQVALARNVQDTNLPIAPAAGN